jgi:hypothetical protein
MPTKYVLLAFSGEHKDENHFRVLTNRLMDLENCILLDYNTWNLGFNSEYW